MRSAKVISLHVGGLGNKIFNSGDTVYENNFPVDNFDKMIQGGFIKENGEPAASKIIIDREPEPEKTPEPKAKTLDDMDLGFGESKKQKKK